VACRRANLLAVPFGRRPIHCAVTSIIDSGNFDVSMEMTCELVRVREFDVAVWLHTVNDPPEADWHQACRVQGEYVLSKHGDLSAYRIFVVSDGAAPNTPQRKEYFKEVLRGYPVKTAVITTILRTSAAKRGIATALHWFNPNFRVFEPKDIVLAMDHLGVPFSGFDPIWKALTLMQKSLPPNATLGLIATQMGRLKDG
jgi:hypothetical protein